MDVTGLLGVLVGIVVPTIGAIFAYGRLSQRVKDQTEDIDDLKKRVERSEGVAAAFEHLGDKISTEIKHVAEVFATETRHTREQLAEIKDDVRSMRAAPTRPRAAAR